MIEAKNKILECFKITNRNNGFISIFPDNLPFIHINLIIDNYNLLLTLTPSQITSKPLLLTYQNLFVNNQEEILPNFNYSLLPILEDLSHICSPKKYYIEWKKNLHHSINIHPDDTIIIISSNGETLTSCNEKRIISMAPLYDLFMYIDNKNINVCLYDEGKYYFTSRSNTKYFFLEVNVKKCQCFKI